MSGEDAMLERALVALDEGRDDDAHAALAAAWRERRSPALAELAELANQRRPAPMQARLNGLAASRVAIVLERLAAFADDDDPLFAGWVLRALETPPFTGPSSRPLLDALIDAAWRMRDPRLVARRDAIEKVWQHRVTPKPSRVALTGRLYQAAKDIGPVSAPSEDEARLEAAIAGKLRGAAEANRTLEELLADVYANPADDAPRLVLADFLLERGDPRGELIALQFKRRDGGPPSDEALAREAHLLKKHGKEWLGPLAPVISWGKGYSKSTFERGFLAVADIIFSAGKKVALVAEEPSWAVVEEVINNWDPELLYRAPLHGLRRATFGPAHLLALHARGRVFPHLERLETDGGLDDWDWDLIRRMFPALVELLVTFERGPSVEEARRIVATVPCRRIVFRRWAGERGPYVPFDELVREICALEPRIPELALEPLWRHWPRPDLTELRVVGGRYAVTETRQPRPA